MIRAGTMVINDDQEKVELFLSCRKLGNNEAFGTVNSQIKVFLDKKGQLFPIGETDIIKENINPNFTHSLILDFSFEIKQRLVFQVLNHHGSKSEIIGTCDTTLGEIVGSKNQTAIFDIKSSTKSHGKMIVRYEMIAQNNCKIFMEFNGNQLLDVSGCFGSLNPVLRLMRAAGETGFVTIFETDVAPKTKAPIWKGFEMPVQKICNGDYFRPIQAEIYSKSRGGKETLIGTTQFTLNEIINQEIRKFTLKNTGKKKSNSGELILKNFNHKECPTFLEYLKGGLQLAVVLAVDFTGSNGDPSSPDSLHAFKYDGSMNDYQKAIYGVCDILLNYDSDKKIPMFGFGGIPHFPNFNTSTVQHCFSMTGDPENPWAYGLDSIMATYKHALDHSKLSGPTLFAPILSEAMKIAQQQKQEGSNEYTILLIISDGIIDDMEASINCLINSARLPLSVIIVGVGNADFSNMVILDGDDGLQNSNGVKAERDLVQFVPFREISGGHEELARQVLEEIPDQVVEYMTMVGVSPKKVQPKSMAQILRVNTLDEILVIQNEDRGGNVSVLSDKALPGKDKLHVNQEVKSGKDNQFTQ